MAYVCTCSRYSFDKLLGISSVGHGLLDSTHCSAHHSSKSCHHCGNLLGFAARAEHAVAPLLLAVPFPLRLLSSLAPVAVRRSISG